MTEQPHMLVLGPGYSARAIIDRLLGAGFLVSASYRRAEARAELLAAGVAACEITEDGLMLPKTPVTHVLSSVAPPRANAVETPPLDPMLDLLLSHELPRLRWVGYLSSTTVYGDRGGAWVDETSHPMPHLVRAKRRLMAEQAWAEMARTRGVALQIFRLAGIYGPGRSALDSVRAGRARRIIKQGQVFGRIHVDDIAAQVAKLATMDHGSDIFNLADEMPCAPQDVIAYAADLLGVDAPPEIAFEDADLSPMAQSFYADCKRVRADHIRRVTGLPLTYPDYKAGLRAILAAQD